MVSPSSLTLKLPGAFDGLHIEIENHTGGRFEARQYAAQLQPDNTWLVRVELHPVGPDLQIHRPDPRPGA